MFASLSFSIRLHSIIYNKIGIFKCFADAPKKIPLKEVIIPKSDLLEQIHTNPEFFVAFPSITEYLSRSINKLSSLESPLFNLVKNECIHREYFHSLRDQRINAELKNILNFEKNYEMERIEGFRDPQPCLKYLSWERKEKIHIQIDYKMKELEDTGKSREEIVFGKKKGLKLTIDPFFQYLKKNRTARELMFYETEPFTCERFIFKVLCQDLDRDRSLSTPIETLRTPSNEFKDYNNPLDLESSQINSSSYYYDELQPHNIFINKFIDEKSENPDILQEVERKYKFPKFINKPLSKKQLRERFPNNVRKSEIHWKNTELLCQFMDKNGKIMHRDFTRLNDYNQRKVSRCIKQAINMGLLPVKGGLRPFHKLNVTSFANDLYKMGKKKIDIQLGTVSNKFKEDLPENIANSNSNSNSNVYPSKINIAYTKEEMKKEEMEKFRDVYLGGRNNETNAYSIKWEEDNKKYENLKENPQLLYEKLKECGFLDLFNQMAKQRLIEMMINEQSKTLNIFYQEEKIEHFPTRKEVSDSQKRMGKLFHELQID